MGQECCACRPIRRARIPVCRSWTSLRGTGKSQQSCAHAESLRLARTLPWAVRAQSYCWSCCPQRRAPLEAGKETRGSRASGDLPSCAPHENTSNSRRHRHIEQWNQNISSYCFRSKEWVIGCWHRPEEDSMNANLAVNPIKRLAYAFVGLLAGNTILLLFLLQNAIRIRALLLASHMGKPALEIPLALQMSVLYASFSLAGWLLVG